MYSLIEGVGFGRASVSVLFRSFKVDMPKELRGWDTGTIHILSDVKIEVDKSHADKLEGDRLVIGNTESTSKVPAKVSTKEGSSIVWVVDPSIRLPVYSRYQSAVHFNVGGGGMLNGGPGAFASLWLQDIPDDEECRIRIPLVHAEKAKQLRQNYINDVTEQTHKFQRIGYLTCKVMLDSGLDADHEQVSQRVQALRHNFGEYIDGTVWTVFYLIAYDSWRRGLGAHRRTSKAGRDQCSRVSHGEGGSFLRAELISALLEWTTALSTGVKRRRLSVLINVSSLPDIAVPCNLPPCALLFG